MMIFTQHSEHLKTVRSQEVAGYSHASKDCLRGDMQIIVKMLTGKTITFDVENQQHHRQCERQGRHSSRPVIALRRDTARRREDTVDCNIKKAKLCVARHLDEVQ